MHDETGSPKQRHLSGEEAITKCHVGKGELSCRFLAHSQMGGFQCLAVVPIFRREITRQALRGNLVALGDVCNDPFDSTSSTVLEEQMQGESGT